MKILVNEEGFTLIEIIIIAFVISIAIGFATLGINIVFSANIDSFAEQYHSDLRDVRSKTVSTLDHYELNWYYVGENYHYDIVNVTKGYTEKTATINRNISIQIKVDASANIELNAYNIPSPGNPIVTIEFDSSSGKLMDAAVLKKVEYTFVNERDTSETRSIDINAKLGRVYLNE